MRARTLLNAILFTAAGAAAVEPQGLTGPAVFYLTPGDHQLATVAEGTVLDPGRTSNGFVQVTLRGYVSSSLLGGRRDSFPVSVGASGVRLRAQPSTTAPVVAELLQGMGFHLVKRTRGWAEVERQGWVRRSAFPVRLTRRTLPKAARAVRPEPRGPKPRTRPPSPRPKRPPPSAGTLTSPPAATDTGNVNALTPDSTAPLAPAPSVAPVATLRHGAVLTPLARDRGWVRVRLEGWMRETDLVAADSSIARLSAADLRANPGAYVGRTVRWTVTSLAFQTAGPLRKDMQPDEPYLLARGPGSEDALLYLALPSNLVAQGKALAPMTKVVITAKVRTGKSDPSGVPILDVLTLTTR